MFVRVLGASAGGGLPQWNCGCENCVLVRAGDPRIVSRTQDSIAVSGDGDAWHLLNASPDVLRHIESFAKLHPRDARHSPIASITLTNGDLDHCLGLLSLRESYPLTIFATASVWRGLVDHNAFLRTLKRFDSQCTWRELTLDVPIDLPKSDLSITARAIPGKLPVHLTGVVEPSNADNVGVWISSRANNKTIAYLTAASKHDAYVEHLANVDALFFDGSFWSDDELMSRGLSRSRASDMAHWPIGGDDGSLANLKVSARRKIYTHINNTNPILRSDSKERAACEARGWEIAFDGMEIQL